MVELAAAAARDPVSRTALMKRVNRRLAHDGEKLHASRSWMALHNFGAYYVLDRNGVVLAWHIELVQFAKELGCFRPGEFLVGHDFGVEP
jgi:hypothetical protein